MQSCAQCRMALEEGPEGLCPACLMRGLYATDVDDLDPETQTETAVGAGGGDSFGPYRILYPLGEGGMGTVYLAAQDEPIRRRVALKVIKQGMDSKDVLARFRRERQALALMDHSSIARIFDAGTSANGRPYFVMEYVNGTPITRYCDQRRLPVKGRLELFTAVCRAVQHAHQKGVIHRDIKPSNILVTEQDGQPVPKIIDFGIAKPAVAGGTGETLFTQFGQMVGTPQYASPEQADVVGGEVGAASDVYSLGVLVYELLVGAVPFDPARLKNAGLAEMLRIIREEDPPPLSSKLTAAGSDTGALAALRDTNPSALRKLLERDLDWIVHKALEKNPSSRYESVERFAADIGRFLNGQAVHAAPPSLFYRIRKTVRRNRVAASIAGGVAFGAAAVLGWFLYYGQHQPKLTDKDSIVIADFANSTGDPVFDETLRQGLTSQLAQSPYLFLQTDGKINAALRQMKHPASEKLTPEVAREVCERTGSTAVAEGSLAKLGTEYVLGLRLRNCRTGELLDSEQLQAPRKEEVLNALSRMAKGLRSRAGESLATVEKYSVPLEATTTSLDALKAYSEGLRAHNSGQTDGARMLERAIELDPQFAMAHAMLGQSLETRDEHELAAQHLRKAYELRDRVTDAERLSIIALFERLLLGNFERARQTCELWAQTYPREAMPHGFLAGVLSGAFAKYESGSEHARKALELDPAMSIAYFNLALNQVRLENRDEAAKVLDQATKKGVSSQELWLIEYELGFLRNDEAAMQRAVAASRGKPDAEGLLLYAQALSQAFHGRFHSAGNLMEQARAVAVRAGYKERSAQTFAAEGIWQGLFGNVLAAREAANKALAILRGRDVTYEAALALSMAGDSKAAQALGSEMETLHPEDTSIQFSYLPVLRARLALNAGAPVKAIEALLPSQPTELGAPRVSGGWLIGALYPCYFRGQALLTLGRATEAAAEFQKILDHPGITVADPIGPAARLQLARAWLAAGNREKAKQAYRQFLDLWKDADAGTPALVQAKQEMARLL